MIVLVFARLAPGACDRQVIPIVRAAVLQRQEMFNRPDVTWAQLALASVTVPAALREQLCFFLVGQNAAGIGLECVAHFSSLVNRTSLGTGAAPPTIVGLTVVNRPL